MSAGAPGVWRARTVLAGVAACFLAGAPVALAQGGGGWTLATSQFSGAFTAQPYVGNGYLGARIPAAGMGYLGGEGLNGWPTFSERTTTSIARGFYAQLPAPDVASGGYGSLQVIADLPTWSTLDFGTLSGTYSAQSASAQNVSDYAQSLDLRSGVVTTSGVWAGPGGERARFVYRVLADRARRHIAVVSLQLTPLWSGPATVTSLLDGAGSRRTYGVDAGFDSGSGTSYLGAASTGLNIPLGEAAVLRFSQDVRPMATVPIAAPAAQTAGERLTFIAQADQTYTFTKYVAIVTGRDSQRPEDDARNEVQQATSIGAAALSAESSRAWSQLWEGDIVVDGNPALQATVRASEYSLWASAGIRSPGSIGPSGLSSEGYGGLVFWDADTWMYPAVLAQHPDLARMFVDYRYQTLAAARRNAAEYGLAGAFYPWTSAYDGGFDTNCYGVVAVAGKPVSDTNQSCTQELHLQGDIALAQWQYYEVTRSRGWLARQGWPVLEGIAQFWASRATPAGGGRYAIDGVQPPDESVTGVNNSTYTNAVAALALERASVAGRLLGKRPPAQWARVARGLVSTMPSDPQKHIYLEYDNYNGATIKQADVVMLTYPLQFPMPRPVAANDVSYYAPRTSPGGPAMTDAIHSIDVSALNEPGCSAYTYLLRAYSPFVRAPFLQFSETRDDTISGLPVAAFDFLTGAGGFVQSLLYGYSGLRLGVDNVYVDPSLSPQLKGLTLRDLKWQGRTFTIQIRRRRTTVTLTDGRALPLLTPRGPRLVRRGSSIEIRTRRPDMQPTADLARCRPAVASSSVAGNDPVAAVDGSTATNWTPTSAQATLTVDLQRIATVRRLAVERAAAGQFAYGVDASLDGRRWYTIASVAASSAGSDHITVKPTRARFIRLSFPGGITARTPSIAELSVFGRTVRR